VDGKIHIGLQGAQLERLAQGGELHKISTRDFAPAIAKGWSGGTTVAGTLLAAFTAGIQVFATGGIGGVHRQPAFDISTDLQMLARCPLVVVCAGAKAILDLPATLEYLETMGVPVVGYQTGDFRPFIPQAAGFRPASAVIHRRKSPAWRVPTGIWVYPALCWWSTRRQKRALCRRLRRAGDLCCPARSRTAEPARPGRHALPAGAGEPTDRRGQPACQPGFAA